MATNHVKIANLSKSCRLCLEHSDELYAIFQPLLAANIADLIHHLTGINPSDTDGPLGICSSCLKQISDFMSLRRKSEASNAQLIETAGSHVRPISKESEVINATFNEQLLLSAPLLELHDLEPETNLKNETESDDDSQSDPLEGDELQSDDQFKVRKLSKRDLNTPKAYYGLCNICGKEYKHLWRHLESHSTVPVDRCKVCGKEFKSKAGLQMHVLMHQDAEHPCDVCGKKYRTKNRLKRHYRVHTNDRPFTCDICGKKFYTKYNLDVHSRTHTGAKPFTCQFCGQQFTHSYAIKNHMVRFHLEILALKDP